MEYSNWLFPFVDAGVNFGASSSNKDRLLESEADLPAPHTSSLSVGIAPFRLFLALLCLIIIVAFSFYLKLGIESKIIVCITRSILQLLLAGYVLLGFIFGLRSPYAVVAYLCFMSFIASLEVTARQTRTYNGHFVDSLITVFVSGGIIGAYGSSVVFYSEPWWEPHIMIPTAGIK